MVSTEVIFKFPRLYPSVTLGKWEFGLDLGWFWADIGVHQWRFGPSLTLSKLCMPGGDVSHFLTLEFFAFTRHLVVALGVTRNAD